MGKAEYCSLRKANRNAPFNKYNAPNYLSYAKLATLINNIEIGELHNASPSLTYNLDDDEIKDGGYRNIAEYAIRLATFYLHASERRVDKLKCFDSLIQKKKIDSFIFAMAFIWWGRCTWKWIEFSPFISKCRETHHEQYRKLFSFWC